MKNIHVLPTDKPSRLHKIGNEWGLTHNANSNPFAKQQNIYIISDEKIEEGGWFYDLDSKYIKIKQSWENSHLDFNGKKIILTTDQDLIKDGVQAIDDKFLELFVKHPDCEEIEIENYVVGTGFTHIGKTPSKQESLRGCYDSGEQIIGKWEDCHNYKIIIPKVEPKQETLTYTEAAKKEERIFNSTMMKQETLEEDVEMDETIAWHLAKKRFAESFGHAPDINKKTHELIVSSLQEGILAGVKWQAEKMYSEEEVKHIISEALQSALVTVDFEQWFKQFKKK